MKKINYKKLIFWVLILIGIAVRIYHFPTALQEMNTDEIMTVVNAKAIVDTGKELNQISFPVYLQGWGGQSVILLYLMALSIKILGYSLFSIRLPMLLVSLLSMFVFYDLVKKISKNTNIALIALGLLSICPWHILQSIWALDCNMFPHFLLIAIDVLYTGIVKEKKSIVYSSMLFFAISLYGYGVAIYFVPFFLLFLAIYLVRIQKLKIKDMMICIIIFLLFSMSIITMFAINGLHIHQNIQIGNITIPYYEHLTRTKDMLFFSENPIKQFGHNLLSTLKVIFWQTDGAEWNSSKLFGATYGITLLFTIIGLIKIIKQKKKNKTNIESVILILWISISLVTGIIVNNANINRLNSIWYVLLILAAFGMDTLYEKIKYKRMYQIAITSLYSILFLLFAIYFHVYYVKIIDQSGCFSRGFYQTLNEIKTLDKTSVWYDNIKNDGCLALYIEFNKDNTKTYHTMTEEEELKNKIENKKEEEIIIIDVEYRNKEEIPYDKQIGDYIIII